LKTRRIYVKECIKSILLCIGGGGGGSSNSSIVVLFSGKPMKADL
jgi:hypothetical protein